MKQADDPNLADLKKLLKRLEKIDPEARQPSPPDSIEPVAGNARKLKDAVLDRPANDEDPVEGLLQLRSRNGGSVSSSTAEEPSELPVIVRHTLPATTDESNEPATFQTVIIASITAAVVSALATAGTVYWLNVESNRLAFETSKQPPTAPVQQGTISQAALVPSDRQAEGTGNTTSPISAQPADTAPAFETTAAPSSDDRSKPKVTTALPDSDRSVSPDATKGSSSAASAETSGGNSEFDQEGAEPTAESEARGPNVAALAGNDLGQDNQITTGSETSGVAGLQEELSAEIRSERAPNITPPRPQLVGIPDVSGELTASQTGPQLGPANQPATAPPSTASETASEFGPARPATAIDSARELVAALTTSNAFAAEVQRTSEIEETKPAFGFVGATTLLGDSGTLSASSERTVLGAATETKASVVAVFEAPPEAGPEIALDEAASQGLLENSIVDEADPAKVSKQKPEITAALDTWGDAAAAVSQDAPPATPAPQVGPGEVALHHPGSVPVPVDQPIDFPLTVLGEPDELAGHYLIISGLKRGSRPSVGSELMFDTWRVEVSELPDLKLSVPTGFARRMHLDIELRSSDGHTRKKSTLILTMAGSATSIVDRSEEAPGLPASVLRFVDDAEIQIDNGNLLSARVLFMRAADAGSSRAAMLMAATYDPNYASKFNTVTPAEPESDEARRWYDFAAELGAPGAQAYAERLPAN